MATLISPLPLHRLLAGVALCLLGVTSAGRDLAQTPPASAPAEDRILWLMPEVDASAANAGSATASAPGATPQRRGLSQSLAEYLEAHWGGSTRHQVMIVNVKRGWLMVEAGEAGCRLGALHTPERERLAVFHDTHMIPPPQLMLRRAQLPLLPRNAAGEVDLEAMWQQGRLRGAMIQGRSYGAGLDALLARRPARAIEDYALPDFGGNMLGMLAAGRADYTLEYDFMLQHMAVRRESLADIVSVPIQGHSETLVSGVACPRNDWGRRTLARVAQILQTPAARRMLKAEVLAQLSPEALARYGPRIEAFYARPPSTATPAPVPVKPPSPARPAPPPR